MKFSGRCLCGAIQYEGDTEIKSTSVCHCTDCQRQTGTTSSLVIEVVEEAFIVSGDSLKTFTTVGTDHGSNTYRSFCGNCGSPIYSRIEAFPGTVFIKAGTLNDTTWLNPTEELWCKSQQLWVLPIPGATRYERDIPVDDSSKAESSSGEYAAHSGC
jgi:hypothetical protein